MSKLKIIALIALLFSTLSIYAEVKLPVIFQDHMILQQGVPIVIWGTASPGEDCGVYFKESNNRFQLVPVTADADGNWRIELPAMKASSEPCELSVGKGSNMIVIKDILIGEVWLASGQSNMVSGVKQVPGSQRKIFAEQKDNKRVRAFIKDKWYLLSEQALHTSAVGFFFALKLEQTLDVPVAYVVVAALGSKIEPFVPPEEAEKAKLGKKASGIFNSRIAPISSYPIKGVIWYQGESNAGSKNYFDSLKALHSGWSRVFKMPKIPFYQVQIAPYNKAMTKTSRISDCVWIAQYRAAEEIPGMGVIPLHDTGISVKRIHPSSKQPVGERLAAMALKNQYGKDVVTSGPVFSKAVRDGNKVIVSFDKIDKGLITNDGKAPSFFELSADGKTFTEATATIKGNKVEVVCDSIAEPRFVRMGWFDIAIPNLRDKNGWPVFAFPGKEIQ